MSRFGNPLLDFVVQQNDIAAQLVHAKKTQTIRNQHFTGVLRSTKFASINYGCLNSRVSLCEDFDVVAWPNVVQAKRRSR
jgi:hypothetical protein